MNDRKGAKHRSAPERFKVWIFIWSLFSIVWQSPVCSCQAMEALVTEFGEQEEYRQLEQTIDSLLGNNGEFDLSDYISAVLSGKEALSVAGIGEAVQAGIRAPFEQLKGVFVRLVAVILFTAVFTSFAKAFRNGQVAESGFYVLYLVLFSMLAAGYLQISSVVTETLSRLFGFMQALIPVFSATLFISAGSVTSYGAAGVMLMLLAVLDKVLISVLLPCIHVYMMVVLSNHIMGEAPLGKLAELIRKIVRMVLKVLLGLAAGVTGLQAMVAPALDQTKRNSVIRVSELIPGIGKLFGSVADTLLGAGNVLKGAVGSAGVIVVVLLCMIPLMKVLLHVLCYRVTAAVVEPVADKRVLGCLSDTAEGVTMLLQLIFTGAASFILTLAVLIQATS